MNPLGDQHSYLTPQVCLLAEQQAAKAIQMRERTGMGFGTEHQTFEPEALEPGRATAVPDIAHQVRAWLGAEGE